MEYWGDNAQFSTITELFSTINGFFNYTWEYGLNDPYNKDPFWGIGAIGVENRTEINNEIYEFPANTKTDNSIRMFGANWLNLSIYFPQLGRVNKGFSLINEVKFADYFHNQRKNDRSYNGYYVDNNTQEIAAGIVNTKHFARNDLHWTDIIEIPEGDIKIMNNKQSKGFTSNNISLNGSEYRNGISENIPTNWSVTTPCPYNGGKKMGNAESSVDTKTYFYKGFDTADCIQYLFELGIITGE